MKKRDKHYLVAFFVGYLGITCLMVYVIYARGIEANFLRLLVFPVATGVLFAFAAWVTHAVDRMHRREREDFRRRGRNYKAYQRAMFVLAVLLACALAVYEIWT